jgi:hypothetical protein
MFGIVVDKHIVGDGEERALNVDLCRNDHLQ